MCGICGCGEGHAHDASHAHGHRHASRRVEVEQSLLQHNRVEAEALAKQLAARGIDALALLGAPGAGKTAWLEATFERIGPGAARREAVVEGDCATDLDARRIAARGARVAQIETGALCHLDAHLVAHALAGLDLAGVERLWIENVGNLVCPAPFPCGERRRVVLVSVAEGDDKPEKYPALFAGADLLVISKVDLLPHVDFDIERCIAGARRARPALPAILASARSGAGLDAWFAWLRGEAT